MLKEKLQSDLKDAMRAKDAERVSTLRMVWAAIGNWEIEQRGKGRTDAPTDEEIVGLLRKESKKRREAATAFHAGNREELAGKEEREAAIIEAYLPAQLSENAIRQKLAALVAGGATTIGALMKEGMKEFRGSADAGTVSRIAKELLSDGNSGN
ncbi:MAG: GatB/YqeY domain-containing protein [Candidatus Liptonbacteria bacterium]|nr:GatB/YqeY domain-containing protein [Candidatus Liptonbacteria bacterium]